jgi:regulator of protease activity HflC (stomatin/prohibitin superfamily)
MDPNMIWIGLAAVGTAALLSSLRVLFEYERAVVFRLGKLIRAKGPGMIFLLPFGVERMRKMDLRIVALDVAPQDTITKDNVSVKVNAVVYFRVADPAKAVVEIEDYYFATSQLAQTTLRSVIGQSELDELLAERERINHVIQQIIDQGTDAWGVEVTGVEIKDIDLPKEMKRAMARQAEAERERRGKVIAAEGEYQASRRLGQAADVMARHPAALQLRYLQTLVEVAAENNSTTLFPIPIDIFRGLTEKLGAAAAAQTPEPEPDEGALEDVPLEGETPLLTGGSPLAESERLRPDQRKVSPGAVPESLGSAKR